MFYLLLIGYRMAPFNCSYVSKLFFIFFVSLCAMEGEGPSEKNIRLTRSEESTTGWQTAQPTVRYDNKYPINNMIAPMQQHYSPNFNYFPPQPFFLHYPYSGPVPFLPIPVFAHACNPEEDGFKANVSYNISGLPNTLPMHSISLEGYNSIMRNRYLTEADRNVFATKYEDLQQDAARQEKIKTLHYCLFNQQYAEAGLALANIHKDKSDLYILYLRHALNANPYGHPAVRFSLGELLLKQSKKERNPIEAEKKKQEGLWLLQKASEYNTTDSEGKTNFFVHINAAEYLIEQIYNGENQTKLIMDTLRRAYHYSSNMELWGSAARIAIKISTMYQETNYAELAVAWRQQGQKLLNLASQLDIDVPKSPKLQSLQEKVNQLSEQPSTIEPIGEKIKENALKQVQAPALQEQKVDSEKKSHKGKKPKKSKKRINNTFTIEEEIAKPEAQTQSVLSKNEKKTNSEVIEKNFHYYANWTQGKKAVKKELVQQNVQLIKEVVLKELEKGWHGQISSLLSLCNSKGCFELNEAIFAQLLLNENLRQQMQANSGEELIITGLFLNPKTSSTTFDSLYTYFNELQNLDKKFSYFKKFQQEVAKRIDSKNKEKNAWLSIYDKSSDALVELVKEKPSCFSEVFEIFKEMKNYLYTFKLLQCTYGQITKELFLQKMRDCSLFVSRDEKFMNIYVELVQQGDIKELEDELYFKILNQIRHNKLSAQETLAYTEYLLAQQNPLYSDIGKRLVPLLNEPNLAENLLKKTLTLLDRVGKKNIDCLKQAFSLLRNQRNIDLALTILQKISNNWGLANVGLNDENYCENIDAFSEEQCNKIVQIMCDDINKNGAYANQVIVAAIMRRLDALAVDVKGETFLKIFNNLLHDFNQKSNAEFIGGFLKNNDMQEQANAYIGMACHYIDNEAFCEKSCKDSITYLLEQATRCGSVEAIDVYMSFVKTGIVKKQLEDFSRYFLGKISTICTGSKDVELTLHCMQLLKKMTPNFAAVKPLLQALHDQIKKATPSLSVYERGLLHYVENDYSQASAEWLTNQDVCLKSCLQRTILSMECFFKNTNNQQLFTEDIGSQVQHCLGQSIQDTLLVRDKLSFNRTSALKRNLMTLCRQARDLGNWHMGKILFEHEITLYDQSKHRNYLLAACADFIAMLGNKKPVEALAQKYEILTNMFNQLRERCWEDVDLLNKLIGSLLYHLATKQPFFVGSKNYNESLDLLESVLNRVGALVNCYSVGFAKYKYYSLCFSQLKISNSLNYVDFDKMQSYAQQLSDIVQGNSPEDRWWTIFLLEIIERCKEAQQSLQNHQSHVSRRENCGDLFYKIVYMLGTKLKNSSACLACVFINRKSMLSLHCSQESNYKVNDEVIALLEQPWLLELKDAGILAKYISALEYRKDHADYEKTKHLKENDELKILEIYKSLIDGHYVPIDMMPNYINALISKSDLDSSDKEEILRGLDAMQTDEAKMSIDNAILLRPKEGGGNVVEALRASFFSKFVQGLVVMRGIVTDKVQAEKCAQEFLNACLEYVACEHTEKQLNWLTKGLLNKFNNPSIASLPYWQIHYGITACYLLSMEEQIRMLKDRFKSFTEVSWLSQISGAVGLDLKDMEISRGNLNKCGGEQAHFYEMVCQLHGFLLDLLQEGQEAYDATYVQRMAECIAFLDGISSFNQKYRQNIYLHYVLQSISDAIKTGKPSAGHYKTLLDQIDVFLKNAG